MNRLPRGALAVVLALLPALCIAQASTLKERTGAEGTLSPADETAILVAAVELCEQRLPDFRAQAAPHLARLRAKPTFQEVANSAEYARVLPEAQAYIQERYRSVDVQALCRNALNYIHP